MIAAYLPFLLVGVRLVPHRAHFSSVSSTDLSLLEVGRKKRRLCAFQRRSFETAEMFVCSSKVASYKISLIPIGVLDMPNPY